jgi:hypothetical protein
MNLIMLAERKNGTRRVLATDWPIYDRLQYDTRLGVWIVTYGLCNGVPDRAETYRSRAAADHAFYRGEEAAP